METMEVKTADITQEVYDNWSTLSREQECAECGSHLTIRTIPEREALALTCAANPSHRGLRQRTSHTEDYRRGAEVHPAIRDRIEAKMMVKEELHRAMNLLALRFPAAIRDIPTASLFINDCVRLGLDPLIQPAEAVPVPFNSKGRATVVMVVTEDGALSMAARGCPDEYDGAPATMPLLDYLMKQHPQRSLVELEQLAKRTARELCDDENAWVWVALGKRRSATAVNPVYGYYKRSEWEDAKNNRIPAATQPGNQARVRAVKRWVRETFPEARQKMLEYTRDLSQRTGGIPELEDFIDTEYTVITGPVDKKSRLISPPGGKNPAGTSKTARTKGAKRDESKVGEPAKRSANQGAGEGESVESAAEPSGDGETTLISDRKHGESQNSREASAAGPIDMEWLRESLQTLKWSDDTARSFIKSICPEIDTDGDLPTVLSRLSRPKAELFTKEINNRLDSQPNLL